MKLQSNFTTPEQSKLLLELGVPADSADCYNTIKHTGKIPADATYKDVWQMSTWRDENGNHIEMYPSWSVGRLMEIFAICFDPDFIHFDTYADGINFLKQMIDKFETYAKIMDFSKLYE